MAYTIGSAKNTTIYSSEGTVRTPLNPSTIASQVTMNDADGAASNVETEIQALRTAISAAVDAGVHFKGAVTSSSGLPSNAYEAGWQYAVKEAGVYAGKECEVGDLILCVTSYVSGSASNSDWIVLQANIDGAVTGPSSSVADHVATFSGTSGKIVQDSGFTIGKSVPADAVFTDTTYTTATTSKDGLMTAAQVSKLAGIETAADVTDATNVAAAGAFMKASDTADDITDGTDKVVMTAAERTKLAGIEEGATKDADAFSGLKVGDTTITATAAGDTAEIAAGDGVTITADATAKTITISESYQDVVTVTSLDDVPDTLRNGGLVILETS